MISSSINLPPFHQRNFSTSRLRAIRDAGLIAITQFKPDKYLIIESATIHCFPDCVMVFGRYLQGIKSIVENETLHKSFAVFSKDLIIWKEYKDQFEPKKGHKAYEYQPHDAPFPTEQW